MRGEDRNGRQRERDKGMMKREEKLRNEVVEEKRHMDEVGRGNIKTLKSKSTLKMEVVWSRFM